MRRTLLSPGGDQTRHGTAMPPSLDPAVPMTAKKPGEKLRGRGNALGQPG